MFITFTDIMVWLLSFSLCPVAAPARLRVCLGHSTEAAARKVEVKETRVMRSDEGRSSELSGWSRSSQREAGFLDLRFCRRLFFSRVPVCSTQINRGRILHLPRGDRSSGRVKAYFSLLILILATDTVSQGSVSQVVKQRSLTTYE